MKEVIINGIKFNTQNEVLEYTKSLMSRNINKILDGDDLKFMWDLVIMNYPNPDAKNLYCANKLIIRKSKHTQNSLWLWVIDNDGKERDVSIHKSVKNLKWDVITTPVGYIYFGKYKDKHVSDVIKDDISYFIWVVNQDWLEVQLRTEIMKELNKINESSNEDDYFDIDF